MVSVNWFCSFECLPVSVYALQSSFPENWIFNYYNMVTLGTSLVVQWLKLHASTARVRVQSLDGELISHMPGAWPNIWWLWKSHSSPFPGFAGFVVVIVVEVYNSLFVLSDFLTIFAEAIAGQMWSLKSVPLAHIQLKIRCFDRNFLECQELFQCLQIGSVLGHSFNT